MQTITIIKPDDWHIHLRDNEYLKTTVKDAARQFARAIIMPNLKPPVTTIEAAHTYRERILQVLPSHQSFQPLMTLYLTEQTRPELVKAAKNSGIIHAFKLYPAGATTHSESGVTKLSKIYPVLAAMQEHDLPLLIHGEMNDSNIDIFDREAFFIEQELIPMIERFPQLRIVLEHITTTEAADFIMQAPANVAATITAHHLLLHRNDLLAGGIRPHYYCLPILKRKKHQQALIKAATSGSTKFFLGTDSAPHAIHTKETSCGCAGIYTAHAAIELYAEAFEKAQALDKLQGFASIHGANFYKLPINNSKIILNKLTWQVKDIIPFGNHHLKPFRAGEIVSWKLVL